MPQPHLSSRRSFLTQLMFGREPLVEDAGRHTLVVVFLRGGADTLNIVVPFADDHYHRNRPTLSIAQPIKLDDYFAFHPKMKPLLPIFHDGRLGIVNAVGSDNPTGSHFETQDQIEHGETYGEAIGGGWLGRFLRSRASANRSSLAAVAIGETLPEVLRGAPSASAIRSIDQIQIQSKSAQAVTDALAAIYGAEVGLLAEQGQQTIDLIRKVERLRGQSRGPENGAVYPDGYFGEGLREIARLIKANVGLQAASVDLHGWDTHFFQAALGGFDALVDVLARGLAAFDTDIQSARSRVTTVVMTEFGRRLYENGSIGTDHGRGFAMFAIGSAIKGGIHGRWPGLDNEQSFPGPGGLEIVHDYRSVLAEILTGPAGCEDTSGVFPRFRPEHVGLVSST